MLSLRSLFNEPRKTRAGDRVSNEHLPALAAVRGATGDVLGNVGLSREGPLEGMEVFWTGSAVTWLKRRVACYKEVVRALGKLLEALN